MLSFQLVMKCTNLDFRWRILVCKSFLCLYLENLSHKSRLVTRRKLKMLSTNFLRHLRCTLRIQGYSLVRSTQEFVFPYQHCSDSTRKTLPMQRCGLRMLKKKLLIKEFFSNSMQRMPSFYRKMANTILLQIQAKKHLSLEC